jgi:hypothetical protein
MYEINYEFINCLDGGSHEQRLTSPMLSADNPIWFIEKSDSDDYRKAMPYQISDIFKWVIDKYALLHSCFFYRQELVRLLDIIADDWSNDLLLTSSHSSRAVENGSQVAMQIKAANGMHVKTTTNLVYDNCRANCYTLTSGVKP